VCGVGGNVEREAGEGGAFEQERSAAEDRGREREGWGVCGEECFGRGGQFLPVDVVGDNFGRCERLCSNREVATEGQHEERHGGGEQPMGEVEEEGREVERHGMIMGSGSRVFKFFSAGISPSPITTNG
jgi:hypothetical protein